MTFVPHIAAAQIPMQSPRTLVGKISEHKIFGMGPNPVENQNTFKNTPRHGIFHNYHTSKPHQNKNATWNDNLTCDKGAYVDSHKDKRNRSSYQTRCGEHVGYYKRHQRNSKDWNRC